LGELRRILDFLRSYERGQRGVLTRVLHGDPVFSNILLNNENQIYFLDMRGCLGKMLTTVGDVVYDLAKVRSSEPQTPFHTLSGSPLQLLWASSGEDVISTLHNRVLDMPFIAWS
jgi:hypothetical protein